MIRQGAVAATVLLLMTGATACARTAGETLAPVAMLDAAPDPFFPTDASRDEPEAAAAATQTRVAALGLRGVAAPALSPGASPAPSSVPAPSTPAPPTPAPPTPALEHEATAQPEPVLIAVRAAEEAALQQILAARRASAPDLDAAASGGAGDALAAYVPAAADGAAPEPAREPPTGEALLAFAALDRAASAPDAPPAAPDATGGVAARALFEAIETGAKAAADAAREAERARAFERLLEQAASAAAPEPAVLEADAVIENSRDDVAAQAEQTAPPSAPPAAAATISRAAERETAAGDADPGDALLGAPPAPTPPVTTAVAAPQGERVSPSPAAGLQTYEDLFAPAATRETRRRGVVLIERAE